MANVNILAGKYRPLGYEQITDLSSATSLTVPDGARMAMINAEGADVRWRDDGTAPTASVGYPLAFGESITYSANLGKLQFIEQSASATLNICYYG